MLIPRPAMKSQANAGITIRGDGEPMKKIHAPNRVLVKVIVPSIYNGPNNKSLGRQPKGAIIYVAAGAYADSLIADGLVELAPAPAATRISSDNSDKTLPKPQGDESVAASTESAGDSVRTDLDVILAYGRTGETPISPSAAIPGDEDAEPSEPPLTAAQVYDGAGVTARVASLLFDAGFTSKEQLLASYEANGYDEITGVKGVGQSTAVRVLAWARQEE